MLPMFSSLTIIFNTLVSIVLLRRHSSLEICSSVTPVSMGSVIRTGSFAGSQTYDGKSFSCSSSNWKVSHQTFKLPREILQQIYPGKSSIDFFLFVKISFIWTILYLWPLQQRSLTPRVSPQCHLVCSGSLPNNL